MGPTVLLASQAELALPALRVSQVSQVSRAHRAPLVHLVLPVFLPLL
jgi:hypothetical protein